MQPLFRPLRAFTLIELLVVVSIIALLIGILLPALGAARDSARAVQCLSLVRQYGLGNVMYSNEHDGWFAPILDITAPTGRQNWMVNRTYLQYVSKGEIDGDLNGFNDPGFLCPEAETAIRKGQVFLSYGMNEDGLPSYSRVIISAIEPNFMAHYEPAMASMSTGMMILDGLDWRLGSIANNNFKPNPENGWRQHGERAYSGPGGLSPTGVVAYRHPGETVNAAFFDGHAASRGVDVLWNGGDNADAWIPDYRHADWWE